MKVLILGGRGYIGSQLSEYLSHSFEVASWDLLWFGNHVTEFANHQKDVNKYFDDIRGYDAVVLLAAHSSVKMCVDDYYSSFNNNVRNFINVAEALRRNRQDTKLIYASSSSIYGFTDGKIVDETSTSYTCTNNYDLSKYTMDQYMIHGKRNGQPILKEWYGLRFGTVNGFSRNFRSELMINSMTSNAIDTGQINISNKHIRRAILGMQDLCNAIYSMIQFGNESKSGIYNISSFNDTVENIANKVSEVTKAPVIDHGVVGTTYDFMISNEKFENAFGFKFRDTTETIVNGIVKDYSKLTKTNRNNGVVYA